MKEDILEQIVAEYLHHKGYFTIHNVKFKPSKVHPDYISKDDSNHSDIDVLGYNPTLFGTQRVLAISCKSWQAGFNPVSKIREIEGNKSSSGRDAWKGFRELCKEKWSIAFLDKIEEVTQCKEFTYITAVTKLKSSKYSWENYPHFNKAMRGNPIKILTLNEMLDEVYQSIQETPASTSVGRFMQVVKASQWIKEV